MNARCSLQALLFLLLAIAGFYLYKNQLEHAQYKFDNQKQMVVIIPSYNNQAFYQKNLDSVFTQQYENYHVVYVDDCSSDDTYNVVKAYITEHNLDAKVTLIKNQQRRGAMANLYDAIHGCVDNAIVVTVDGDDWFAHDKVLARLNKEYADPHVWLTYGQFAVWPSGQIGCCAQIPARALTKKDFREQYSWLATHLRTFYAGLFKKIKRQEFMYQDAWMAVTWDKAMMAPMLEMADGRWKFIPEVLYVYNHTNPISDFKLLADQAWQVAQVIFEREPYKPLEAEQSFVRA